MLLVFRGKMTRNWPSRSEFLQMSKAKIIFREILHEPISKIQEFSCWYHLPFSFYNKLKKLKKKHTYLTPSWIYITIFFIYEHFLQIAIIKYTTQQANVIKRWKIKKQQGERITKQRTL